MRILVSMCENRCAVRPCESVCGGARRLPFGRWPVCKAKAAQPRKEQRMDIFGVLTLVGGLALFLYGMETMSSALSKASGGRLEQILEKLTSSKWKGVLLGALVTAVIQSSSATTVMVVGFVNSGIMRLSQAVGVIMGANIGTTATSWILSLASLEGDSLLVQLLKPSTFTPVLAAVGVVIVLFSKKEKQRDWAQVLLGFAVLMFGMETMSLP